MYFNDRAVQRHCLDLDLDNLLTLKLFKHAIQHTAFGPAVHPRVDGMPIAKSLRQGSPFAPLLGNEQNSVEHLKIGEANVASLSRQARLDPLNLGFGDFHVQSIPQNGTLVLTRPR